MKYDCEQNKLVSISSDEIKQLLLFAKQFHPELLPPVGKYGYLNAKNSAKALHLLAGLYFKEVLKAF